MANIVARYGIWVPRTGLSLPWFALSVLAQGSADRVQIPENSYSERYSASKFVAAFNKAIILSSKYLPWAVLFRLLSIHKWPK